MLPIMSFNPHKSTRYLLTWTQLCLTPKHIFLTTTLSWVLATFFRKGPDSNYIFALQAEQSLSQMLNFAIVQKQPQTVYE